MLNATQEGAIHSLVSAWFWAEMGAYSDIASGRGDFSRDALRRIETELRGHLATVEAAFGLTLDTTAFYAELESNGWRKK